VKPVQKESIRDTEHTKVQKGKISSTQMKNAYLQHKHHGGELPLLHLCTPSLLLVAAVAGKMTIVRYHHNQRRKRSKKGGEKYAR
jgi:hypothetical protein